MSKSLNLTGGRMLRVLVWIQGTETFVSSGTAPHRFSMNIIVKVGIWLYLYWRFPCRFQNATQLNYVWSVWKLLSAGSLLPCLILTKGCDSHFRSNFQLWQLQDVSDMVEGGLLSFQLKTINRAVIYCRTQQTCGGRQEGTSPPWHKPLSAAFTYTFCGGVTIVE